MAYRLSGIGAVAPNIDYSGIKGMQQALNYLGMATPALVVDGIMWGPGPSMTALKAFQKSAGITVDGSYGPQSQAALKAAVEKKAAGTTPAPTPPGPTPPGPTPPGPTPPGPTPPGPTPPVTPAAIDPSKKAADYTLVYAGGAVVVLGVIAAWLLAPRKSVR